MKDTLFEKFAAQGLRVVHTSPPLASYVFAVNDKVNRKTRTALLKAFMKLNSQTPEAKAILHTFDQGYDGFMPASDKDYNEERKLISRIQK